MLDEHARRPVPGMAVLLERLTRSNPGAPVIYLSTGAWNVAPTLTRFLSRQLYPAGALLLTDWGPTHDRWFRSGRDHKRESLARLAEEFPGIQWLLVGDDGQHDEDIYGEFVDAHPDNVSAVAIRQLSNSEAVLAGGRSSTPASGNTRTASDARATPRTGSTHTTAPDWPSASPTPDCSSEFRPFFFFFFFFFFFPPLSQRRIGWPVRVGSRLALVLSPPAQPPGDNHRDSSDLLVRHQPAVRTLSVARTTQLTPGFTRITLEGDELDGFASVGPADHVKLSFRGTGVTGADRTPRSRRW